MGDTEKAALERRIYDRCLVRVGQLEAENEQLRELLKFAYDCATSGVSCHDCDLVFGEGNCQLKLDLENMGIEVGK